MVSIRSGSTALLVVMILFTCVSGAAAQPSATGAGKGEVGLFPMGGTFFTGGDDNQEVSFNVYTAGSNLTYYLTERAAIEGELTISFGLAQDILFHKAEVLHVQM